MTIGEWCLAISFGLLVLSLILFLASLIVRFFNA